MIFQQVVKYFFFITNTRFSYCSLYSTDNIFLYFYISTLFQDHDVTYAKAPPNYLSKAQISWTLQAQVFRHQGRLDCTSNANTIKSTKLMRGILCVISIRKKYLASRNDTYKHYQRRLRFSFGHTEGPIFE